MNIENTHAADHVASGSATTPQPASSTTITRQVAGNWIAPNQAGHGGAAVSSLRQLFSRRGAMELLRLPHRAYNSLSPRNRNRPVTDHGPSQPGTLPLRTVAPGAMNIGELAGNIQSFLPPADSLAFARAVHPGTAGPITLLEYFSSALRAAETIPPAHRSGPLLVAGHQLGRLASLPADQGIAINRFRTVVARLPYKHRSPDLQAFDTVAAGGATALRTRELGLSDAAAAEVLAGNRETVEQVCTRFGITSSDGVASVQGRILSRQDGARHENETWLHSVPAARNQAEAVQRSSARMFGEWLAETYGESLHTVHGQFRDDPRMQHFLESGYSRRAGAWREMEHALRTKM